MVKRRFLRHAAVLVAVAVLSSCTGVAQEDLFNRPFWASFGKKNIEAELGLAELAKGNYITAESHFQKALKKNDKDVQALLGAGILYQNTGQTTKARAMYQAILAIRPPDTEQFVVWNNISTRPISEIASVNLSLLDSGGVLGGLEKGAAGQQGMMAPAARAAAPMPEVSGGPAGQAMLGRTGRPQAAAAETVMFAEADANIASRFRTLLALSDQGLITKEEFNTRRQANVGALLPLTSPPPAAGLDRPVPPTEQISGRLRAIGRALEMRAMTIGQHASERSMILDSLMPSAPVMVANPGAPPRGLMEAADSVRRLEQLKEGTYISSDEYAKERRAIELAMQPEPTMSMAPAPAVGKSPPSEMGAMSKKTGPQPAVHLASYRTRKAANRGWSQLRRAHKALLGELSSEITRVNLGPRKGIFFRLKAGPLTDKAAAGDICRKLKSRRQFCEPSFMNAG